MLRGHVQGVESEGELRSMTDSGSLDVWSVIRENNWALLFSNELSEELAVVFNLQPRVSLMVKGAQEET